MTEKPYGYVGGVHYDHGVITPREGSIPVYRIQCDATTKRGKRCAMVPYARTEDNIAVCYTHMTVAAIESIREARRAADSQ